MNIYCCGCSCEIDSIRVTGKDIYPHRPDLYHLSFYRCPTCLNYVGTHKTGEPLGNIPTPQLRAARKRVHVVIDPLWKEKKIRRGKLYYLIAKNFGLSEYHTGDIKTIEFANEVIEFVKTLKCEGESLRK